VRFTSFTQPSLRQPIVVMNLNMPRMNGIEATEHIKRQYSHVAIVGLSVNAETQNQEAMIKAGASVFLRKETAVEQLYPAIQRALHVSSYDV